MADEQPITRREFKEFSEKVLAILDELKTSNAERKYKDDLIDKHDKTLYGDNGKGGHESRISRLEDRVNLLLWLVTLIVTPLLLAIGAGMIKVLQMGG